MKKNGKSFKNKHELNNILAQFMKGNGNNFIQTLEKLFVKIRLLWNMLWDKDYKFSFSTYIKSVFFLIYFLSPIDLIPDYLPLIGYIDDATIFIILVNSLNDEIYNYLDYKDKQTVNEK